VMKTDDREGAIGTKSDYQHHATKAAARREISWWAEPLTSGDADGLVAFAKAHRSIVTTVILECGILTCVRTGQSWGRCANNGGVGGVVTGNVSDACRQVIPELAKVGVRSEVWLGEDWSLPSAQYLFSHAEQTAAALVAVARDTPGLVGFNLDLETQRPVNASDLSNFSSFVSTVTAALNHAPGIGLLRFSVDVGCRTMEWENGDTLESGCEALAQSGVNKLMNMATCEYSSTHVMSRSCPCLRATLILVAAVACRQWP
jgi:hypothetical protein